MKKKNKAQMEIMGLVVIVVLVTLGFFFYIIFTAGKNNSSIKKDFEDDQLASNFVISFLKTDVGCKDYTIETLIQDCAGPSQNIECGGITSCDLIETLSQVYINNTLKKWGKDYNLTIEMPGSPVKESVSYERDCSASKYNVVSAWQPISLYPYKRTARVKLDICQ